MAEEHERTWRAWPSACLRVPWHSQTYNFQRELVCLGDVNVCPFQLVTERLTLLKMASHTILRSTSTEPHHMCRAQPVALRVPRHPRPTLPHLSSQPKRQGLHRNPDRHSSPRSVSPRTHHHETECVFAQQSRLMIKQCHGSPSIPPVRGGHT